MKYVTTNEVETAFDLCAKHLNQLPDKYKKWKVSLGEYRSDWSFLKDISIRNGVAEQEMALDYLWSLDEWMDPSLIFEDHHKLLFIQGLGAIYEAVLIDLWKKEVKQNNRSNLVEVITDGFDEEGLYKLIYNSKKAGLLDDKWGHYLEDLRVVRNLIHLPKRQRNRALLAKGTIFQKSISQLKSNLIDFRDFIKKEY